MLVFGHVVTQAHAPVAGAAVRLDGKVHRSSITDRGGNFRVTLEPTQAGSYRITVTKTGYQPAVERIVVDPLRGADAGTIVLQPMQLAVIGSVVARERRPFNTTPAALKVFPREAYRDQGQASTSTVLAQTPGAYVARNAQRENAAQPQAPFEVSLRGGTPFETAILVDGNPIALPESGTFNLSYIPTFVLQDVEIVKGPGSAATTIPNAIDGAVNLRTAEPGTVRKALLEIEGDSRGGQFSDLAYGGAAPDGRFSFATMFAIDGNTGPAPTINAAGEALQRAQLLKARYALSPASTLTATYLGSQGTLGIAVARGLQTANGSFASYANALDARETHRFGLSSLELQTAAGSDRITARAYGMQLQRNDGFDTVAFPEIGSGLQTTDGIAGFSVADERDDGDDLYRAEAAYRAADASAAYCSSVAHVVCQTLIPSGTRYADTMLQASATLHPAAKTEVNVAGGYHWLSELRTVAAGVLHAGVSYDVASNVTVRAAAGNGIAPAPLAALVTDPAQTLLQTPVNLPPYAATRSAQAVGIENAFSSDAGVEYRLHGDTTTLSADVYHTVTHGAFVETSTGDSLRHYMWSNGPAATRDGLELSLVQFKRVGLGFIAQASLVHESGGIGATPGIPFTTGYGEISYKWPRGSRLSLGALYYGANNPYGRPAFAQLNSNLELSVGGSSKLQFSIVNLTNAYAGSYPIQTGAFNAGVLAPATLLFMFRQSIGPGNLYER